MLFCPSLDVMDRNSPGQREFDELFHGVRLETVHFESLHLKGGTDGEHSAVWEHAASI